MRGVSELGYNLLCECARVKVITGRLIYADCIQVFEIIVFIMR